MQRVFSESGMAAANTLSYDSEILFVTDCEMTGLDVNKHRLLEIYIQVTNNHLEPLESLHIVLTCPKKELDDMDDWCKLNHGLRSQKNGLMTSSLLDDVGHSTITLEQAQVKILSLIDKYTKHAVMLAGCSVYNDRAFLIQGMPKLKDRIHYRVFDFSSLKEASSRFGIPLKIRKFRSNHRAKNDVEASIHLAKSCQNQLFQSPQPQSTDRNHNTPSPPQQCTSPAKTPPKFPYYGMHRQ